MQVPSSSESMCQGCDYTDRLKTSWLSDKTAIILLTISIDQQGKLSMKEQFTRRRVVSNSLGDSPVKVAKERLFQLAGKRATGKASFFCSKNSSNFGAFKSAIKLFLINNSYQYLRFFMYSLHTHSLHTLYSYLLSSNSLHTFEVHRAVKVSFQTSRLWVNAIEHFSSVRLLKLKLSNWESLSRWWLEVARTVLILKTLFSVKSFREIGRKAQFDRPEQPSRRSLVIQREREEESFLKLFKHFEICWVESFY